MAFFTACSPTALEAAEGRYNRLFVSQHAIRNSFLYVRLYPLRNLQGPMSNYKALTNVTAGPILILEGWPN